MSLIGISYKDYSIYTKNNEITETFVPVCVFVEYLCISVSMMRSWKKIYRQ